MNTNVNTMTYSTTSFAISLGLEAHSQAQQIRESVKESVANKEYAEQIYLNSLAVYAVDYYLKCMDFETFPDLKDSINPWMGGLINRATLEVKNIGKLECRPVLSNQTFLEIPEEVSFDRAAYIAVRFNESLRQATILGFTNKATPQISLNHLQSVDDLLDYLTDKEETVNLQQWLSGIVSNGWQNAQEILARRNNSPILVFCDIPSMMEVDKSPYQKVKDFIAKFKLQELQKLLDISPSKPSDALVKFLQTTKDEEILWKTAELLWKLDPDNSSNSVVRNAIDLATYFPENPTALMVAVLEKSDNQVAILNRIYPLENQTFLPNNLKFELLDMNNNKLFSVQSKDKDNYIQFRFTAAPGDEFQLKISIDDVSYTQKFRV
jgi:Protein of unknown function (DUF1822)